uniref:T9SS type A sorting domain-containing protein n=1 Tax=Daejeonella sp. H1SJ63 TaxID=3034145 RepID=UPI0023EC7B87
NTNCGGYAVSSSLVVYPNPASTELNISNTEEAGVKDGDSKDESNPEFLVRLYNEKGNILRSAKNPKGSKGLKLDIAEVPNGTYYLHISKGKEVIRKQVIIQH